MEEQEEARKIQFTGKSSYIVSLPKSWINEICEVIIRMHRQGKMRCFSSKIAPDSHIMKIPTHHLYHVRLNIVKKRTEYQRREKTTRYCHQKTRWSPWTRESITQTQP